jgi:hypothetical protein
MFDMQIWDKTMPSGTHNRFLRGALILGFFAGLTAPSVAYDYTGIPESGEIQNKIFMDGTELGTHNVRFTRLADERLQVDTQIRMRYTFAFVTLFKYDHTSREIWEGGRLESLNSTTDDDGTMLYVRLESGKDGVLSIDASDNRGDPVPSKIIPTSYWNIALTDQKQLLSTQSGKVLGVTVQEQSAETIAMPGTSRAATRFRVKGDLNLDLWYDDKGMWVGTAFKIDGRSFTYELVTPKPLPLLSSD